MYYHRYALAAEAPTRESAGANEYLYVVKIDCCRDPAVEQSFNRWYDTKYLPAALSAAGAIRATRYELYRVLMIEPHEVPHYLTVFEFKASSPDEAMKNLRRALAPISNRMDTHYVEGGATLYLKIKDVQRSR